MMTNALKRGVSTKIKRVFKATASLMLIFIISFSLVLEAECVDVYADTDSGCWAIIVGDEEVVYVDSEKNSKAVIKGIEDYYRTEGTTLVELNITPKVSAKYVETVPKGTILKSVKSAVNQLCMGKRVTKNYTLTNNSTLSKIAESNGISVMTLIVLNEYQYGKNETIKKGTQIKIYGYESYFDVKLTEKLTEKKSIGYKTVYKKTSELKIGTSKVKTKGVKGQKQLVYTIKSTNGEQTSRKLTSTKMIKKATDKVVLKGTANVTAKEDKTFSFRTGSEVVDYAKKYVGNPYKAGGSSLTNGADCSGFVYRVYKNLGVDLPRVDQESVGKKISYKNKKKGDILFYANHVAIYAGDGKAIHAVNERMGIRVTDVDYTGEVKKVRRIFD